MPIRQQSSMSVNEEALRPTTVRVADTCSTNAHLCEIARAPHRFAGGCPSTQLVAGGFSLCPGAISITLLVAWSPHGGAAWLHHPDLTLSMLCGCRTIVVGALGAPLTLSVSIWRPLRRIRRRGAHVVDGLHAAGKFSTHWLGWAIARVLDARGEVEHLVGCARRLPAAMLSCCWLVAAIVQTRHADGDVS